MHDNSNVILEICSAIIITFNVDNVCATNRSWINQEAKNVPEKICDKRKIRWNGIITNNK